jgi:hypothetical protein
VAWTNQVPPAIIHKSQFAALAFTQYGFANSIKSERTLRTLLLPIIIKLPIWLLPDMNRQQQSGERQPKNNASS